jgi:glycosyltransferase involved in cell wall biosynthesis
MRLPLPRVHCELAPVLINRTAVYKMCRAVPRALAQRGFNVTCSALLAKLPPDSALPSTAWNRRLFDYSRRWLHWAIRRPKLFDKTRRLSGLATALRASKSLPLFFDPLYLLFYGEPERGVVLVYDITTVTEPSWHGETVSRLYARAFQLLARSPCHVVASCENTADQLRVNYGIAPSRLTVLHLGLFDLPEPAFNPRLSTFGPKIEDRRSKIEEQFLLFVGQMEPRKNVPGLIQAYARSELYESHGLRLRIIGSVPGDDHPGVQLARATPGVDLMGFVGEDELASSYATCFAFVYPSFCEGFGLPLLEAMHRGCVCLSTCTGASPEVAGDAALFVNPYSVADIADGLNRLAGLDQSERERLSTRARRRAGQFTWPKFYDGLARVLIKAAA